MNKKIFVPLVAAAVVAMGYVGYGAYNSQSEEDALLLENVEALTRGEGAGTRYKCYSSIHYKEGSFVVECSTCESVKNHTDDLLCIHDWCYR